MKALLARATREFADRGFDGARVDEIAEAAGINKRMIYAYFGDKDGLYRAVLDACLGEALELGREGAVPPGATLRARVEGIIRRFFAYLAAHPEFVRLLTWEAVSSDRRGRKILLARLETLVVLDATASELTAAAHVVLPSVPYTEKSGTFMSGTGRVQKITRAVEPPGRARDEAGILRHLARALGHDLASLPEENPGPCWRHVKNGWA